MWNKLANLQLKELQLKLIKQQTFFFKQAKISQTAAAVLASQRAWFPCPRRGGIFQTSHYRSLSDHHS